MLQAVYVPRAAAAVAGTSLPWRAATRWYTSKPQSQQETSSLRWAHSRLIAAHPGHAISAWSTGQGPPEGVLSRVGPLSL